MKLALRALLVLAVLVIGYLGDGLAGRTGEQRCGRRGGIRLLRRRRHSLARRPRVRCVKKASTCRQDLFLYLEHAVVWTSLPRQLFVGSAFDDPASLEH